MYIWLPSTFVALIYFPSTTDPRGLCQKNERCWEWIAWRKAKGRVSVAHYANLSYSVAVHLWVILQARGNNEGALWLATEGGLCRPQVSSISTVRPLFNFLSIFQVWLPSGKRQGMRNCAAYGVSKPGYVPITTLRSFVRLKVSIGYELPRFNVYLSSSEGSGAKWNDCRMCPLRYAIAHFLHNASWCLPQDAVVAALIPNHLTLMLC